MTRASGPTAPARVAFLGPRGTFTEEALLGESDLAEAELVPVSTIAEAILATERGETDAAFVPIENSIEGTVNATIDGLVFGEGLLIQREVVLEVRENLVGLAGTSLSEIRRVLSFPHASAQCRHFLAARLPGAELEATNSTADAARAVAEQARRDTAAIAPAIAAKIYGLEVLADSIEDHAGNQTRFVLVSRASVPGPTGHDRTMIACFQRADHPGSLYEILGQFTVRALNLTRIESRPTKQALGDYCFVIEVEGHVADEILGDCLKELRSSLADVQFLGSYPVPGEAASSRRLEISRRRHEADDWLAQLRSRIAPG